MKIFIGNLNTAANERHLKSLFKPYGEVQHVAILYDAYTKRSRGCGQIEMGTALGGRLAIAALNNTRFMQQSLVVRQVDEFTATRMGS